MKQHWLDSIREEIEQERNLAPREQASRTGDTVMSEYRTIPADTPASHDSEVETTEVPLHNHTTIPDEALEMSIPEGEEVEISISINNPDLSGQMHPDLRLWIVEPPSQNGSMDKCDSILSGNHRLVRSKVVGTQMGDIAFEHPAHSCLYCGVTFLDK